MADQGQENGKGVDGVDGNSQARKGKKGGVS